MITSLFSLLSFIDTRVLYLPEVVAKHMMSRVPHRLRYSSLCLLGLLWLYLAFPVTIGLELNAKKVINLMALEGSPEAAACSRAPSNLEHGASGFRDDKLASQASSCLIPQKRPRPAFVSSSSARAPSFIHLPASGCDLVSNYPYCHARETRPRYTAMESSHSSLKKQKLDHSHGQDEQGSPRRAPGYTSKSPGPIFLLHPSHTPTSTADTTLLGPQYHQSKDFNSGEDAASWLANSVELQTASDVFDFLPGHQESGNRGTQLGSSHKNLAESSGPSMAIPCIQASSFKEHATIVPTTNPHQNDDQSPDNDSHQELPALAKEKGSSRNVASRKAPSEPLDRRVLIMTESTIEAYAWIGSMTYRRGYKSCTLPEDVDLIFSSHIREIQRKYREGVESRSNDTNALRSNTQQVKNSTPIKQKFSTHDLYCLFKQHLNIVSKLKSLLDRIWYLNTRILESLGIKISEPTYQQEQRSLVNWLLKKISKPETGLQDIISAPENKEFEHLELGPLQWHILKLIKFDNNRILWYIPPKYNQKETKYIDEQTALVTKVAVYVIGSYYKETNIEKWTGVFENDNHYLRFLVAITRRISQSYYLAPIKKYRYLLRESHFFPWEKYLTEENQDVPKETMRRAYPNILIHSVDLQLEYCLRSYKLKD